MLLLDETSLEIGPEYTAGLVHTRHSIIVTGADAGPGSGGTAVQLQEKADKTTAPTAPETDAQVADKDPSTLISERFEEQCFLLDAIDLFKQDATTRQTSYKNFLVVDGPREDAAKLVSRVNSRFSKSRNKPNPLKQFINITPAQYSLLVPKIRLFVQKFVSEKDKVGVFQELKFKDWTDKSSVEEMMTTRLSRGDDAGLLNFSYEYDGRDPASTTNMIKASVKLLFTDFDTILKPIRTTLTEREEGMLSDDENSRDFLRPRFLDLILRQPMRRKIKGASLPYLIKVHAEIGWQEPEDQTGQVFPQELREYIRSGNLNEYFVLYMTEHDMDFKEDGRVELTIDFRAAIENILFDNTDILALDSETEEIYKRSLELKQQNLETAKNIQEVTTSKVASGQTRAKKDAAKTGILDTVSNYFAGQSSNAASAGVIDNTDTAVKSQDVGGTTYEGLDEIERFVRYKKRQLEYTQQRQKSARYRSLLDSLGKSEKIRFFDLPGDKVKQWLRQLTSANMAPPSAAKSGRLRAGALLRASGAAQASAFSGKTMLISQNASSAAGTSLAAADEAVVQASRDSKDKLLATQNDKADPKKEKPKTNLDYNKEAADKPHGPNTYRIHFMYLGDIMDIACKTLYGIDKHLGLHRVVAGPVQYFADDGSIQNINLADIPISLEVLSNWIYKKIISKGVSGMSLGSFLSSLTTDLAFKAMGEEKCLTSITGHPSMMMTPITLTLAGTGKKLEEPVARNDSGTYQRITTNDFVKLSRNNLASRGKLTSNDRVTTATYVFITGVVREENNFNYGIGGFDLNAAADGIYTIGIGRDRGIVKNIKFNKSSAKYQSEMRVAQRESSKAAVLGEFRQVYNATVNLVGNTLFKNGQYVRIDPSTIGMDSQVAVSLGLGGYYVITRVEGELSRGGYQTTLSCKYNSAGKVSNREQNPADPSNLSPKSPSVKSVDAVPPRKP
jgi:hypothetical protein